jgi:hypothetical protein
MVLRQVHRGESEYRPAEGGNMSYKAKVFSLLLVTTIFSISLPAQEPGEHSWGNLQRLRVGQKIEVVDTNLKKHKGAFLSFSDEAISLRVKKQEVGVQREDVFRVSLREKSKRLRNALIGLAIGAGAGVAAIEICAQASSGSLPCAGQDFRAVAYAILVPVGGGIGAGIGAAFPPGYQTIYRAEGKRGGTVP